MRIRPRRNAQPAGEVPAEQASSGAAATGETRRVSKLRDQIAEATRLRGLVRNPDLRAVEIERHRRRTLAGLWFFLALGLCYTTTGVQQFLAGSATSADPAWWAAWTVEPMFAGLLIMLLNFEALILSYDIDPDHPWWTRLKRILLASTLGMNVIPQLAPLVGLGGTFNPASALVHALIPLIVYGLAEVIPVIQARARQAIHHVHTQTENLPQPEPEPEPQPTAEPAPAPAPDPEPGSEVEPEPTSAAASTSTTPRTSTRLPAATVAQLQTARDEAQQQGRAFQPADVQAVIKVPEAMATDLAAEFTTNGHRIS